MELLRDISLFWSMAHVTVVFLMLFRSKYEKRKTVILSTIVIGALMLLNCVGLAVLGADIMGKLVLVTCSVPSFIFFWFLSRDKNLSYLFTFCLADTLCLWVLGATNLLDFLLGGGRFILMFVLRLILFPLIEYIIYKKFKELYSELQNVIQKGWGAYAGMTLLYYVLICIMSEFPTHINQRPEYFTGFALVLVLMVFNYLIIFSSLHRQYSLYESEKREEILTEQKRSLETQLESQQYIRKIRHDMRAHTISLRGLLGQNKTNEATEYLAKIEEIIDTDTAVCENPYINAQISHYLQRFKEIDAALCCDIRIGNEDIPFIQVCGILSNALENAYHALLALPKESREASLQMKYNKDYLIFRIKNRCRENLKVKKGEIPKTDKFSKEHGFGLRSIKETAGYLGGDMICYTENGYFVLDVMLQIK